MTRPEKRWQLLMVADDGRIIPFRRIKGVALTLVALLVLAGLACAGLAWQLTAERIRHGRTRDRLANAQRQVEHYKSQHELIAAELVLAEARMEKAGLPVAQRELRLPSKPETVEAPPADQEPVEDVPAAVDSLPAALPEAASVEQTPPAEPVKPAQSAPTGEGQADAAEASGADSEPDPGQPLKPVEEDAAPEEPVVGLGDLTVKLDAARQILTAQFRVKNNGPRSSPVAGRCVVVFKGDGLKPAEWLSLPSVVLTDGKPDGRRGQAFRISRFKDMIAKSAWQSDPSVFDTATVYVFDDKAQVLLVKDYPVDLPALPPASGTPSQAPDMSAPLPADPPTAKGDNNVSDARPAGVVDTGAASLPAAADDPSLMDAGPSQGRDDTRSRF